MCPASRCHPDPAARASRGGTSSARRVPPRRPPRRSERVRAASGSGTPNARLNVLLVIVDSVRSDFVAAYGAPLVETPAIDSLAAQGVRFTRFFPEAMPTVPARRTIMTGRRNFPSGAGSGRRISGAAPAPRRSRTSTRPSRASSSGPATGPPRRATTRSSGSPSRSGPSGSASTATCPSRATAASATTPRPSRGAARALAPGGTERRRPLRGGHPQVPRQHRLRRGRLGVERGARLQGEHEAARGGGGEAAVRPRRGLLRPARALEPRPRVRARSTRTPITTARIPAPLATRARRPIWTQAEVRQMRAVYAAALTIADKWLGEFLERFRELGLTRTPSSSWSERPRHPARATAAGPARSPRSCTPS